MSIALLLKNAAVSLKGTLFRSALIADMSSIETEVNNLDVVVGGLTANVTTTWVSGTTYAIGDHRRSPLNFQTYRRLTNGAGTTDPSLDATNWVSTAAGNASQVFSAAPATAAEHVPQAAQIQSGALVAIAATLTGTEYAATPSPAIAAYEANQAFDVTFVSACPSSPTLKLNDFGSPPNLVRQKYDGSYTNLVNGDFPAGWRSTVRAISASQVLVDKLPPRTYQGSFTRDLSLATGVVTIGGMPFVPREITFYAQIPGTLTGSFGEYSPGVSVCRWSSSVAAQDNVSSTASILAMAGTSSDYQTATVVPGTAFDLDWTKFGNPIGTLSVVYVARE